MSAPSAIRPQSSDGAPTGKARRFGRRALAVGGAVALLIGGGAAYAYWSSTGVGEGEVDTGNAPAFVVTSTPGTGGPLSPGGPVETVDFNVQNPSSGVLNVANVTAAVANADGSAWTDGNCSAADFTVGTPSITYGQIAPGADIDGTVTVQMINRAQNQDDCQGLTVPIYFVAS